jgi:hypothetical protein
MKICLIAAVLCLPLFGGTPAIVDRVAVTVGYKAITESRVDEEIRVTAFLNGEPPTFDAAARRAAADRLVERILLRREIEITGFSAGLPEDYGDPLSDTRARYPDEAAFRAAIAEAKVSEMKLRESLAEQARLLQFIDFRFRPAVSVAEDEARKFYDGEYRALWGTLHPGVTPPVYEEARDEVERLLVDRKVDAQMDDWLAASRAQTRIVYRDEVFQ